MIYINPKETEANYKAFAKEYNQNGRDADGNRIKGYKFLDAKHFVIFNKLLYIIIKAQIRKNNSGINNRIAEANIHYWDIQNLIGEREGLSKRTIYNRIHRLKDVGILRYAIQNGQKGGLDIAISSEILSYKNLSADEIKDIQKSKKGQIFQCSNKYSVSNLIKNKEYTDFSQNETSTQNTKRLQSNPKQKSKEHPPNNHNGNSFTLKNEIEKIFKSSGGSVFAKSLKITVLAIYTKLLAELFTAKYEDFAIETAPVEHHTFIIESIKYLATYPQYFGTCKNEKDLKIAETRIFWGIEAVKRHNKKYGKNLDLQHINRYLMPNSKGFMNVVTNWWNNRDRKFENWQAASVKTAKKIKNMRTGVVRINEFYQIINFLAHAQGNKQYQQLALNYVTKKYPQNIDEYKKILENYLNNDKTTVKKISQTKVNDKFLKSIFGDYELSITVGEQYFDELFEEIKSKLKKLSVQNRILQNRKIQKYVNITETDVWKVKNNSLKFYRALKYIKNNI